MTILRGALSCIAALFLAFTLSSFLGVVSPFRGVAESKATATAVVPSGLLEAAHSPVFWIFAILSSAFFYWTGGQPSRTLRVGLFWIPTLLICVPGFAITALVAYAFLLSTKG
jgi:hypothetical protein